MYPGTYSKTDPDKPAVINANTGALMTYAELDRESIRLARFLHEQCGLQQGDGISLISENRMDCFVVAWAALRSGLYLTAVNRYLTVPEAEYIVRDSQSKVLICSPNLAISAELVAAISDTCHHRFSLGGEVAGCQLLSDALSSVSSDPLPEEPSGEIMLYSSGTTGRPKGVRRPLLGTSMPETGLLLRGALELFGFSADTIYLSPAPLYHAAPLMYSLGTQSLGGTIVMMERFDPKEAIRFIEKYKITHSQWVPTMFVRMLKMDPSEREGFDLSSHQLAVHAAAPCPVEIKRQMIEWWGPILFEYYAGTEGNGTTAIWSEEWLQHPGSVGRPVNAVIHICDDQGQECASGETGTIYFEQEEVRFVYHNDEEKTKSSRHPQNKTWTTLGDVGYLDEEGYLYLTDRKAYMIISGGVNIYPQEIEDLLVLHPEVTDVAVFGIPNEDFGEEVKAVVQPATGVPTDEAERTALAERLTAYARENLASYKIPKSIDFTEELPRLPTGKLYKRLLRDQYTQ